MTPAPPEAPPPASRPQRTKRAALLNAAIEFTTVAALPRTARWLHWSARLSARGLTAFVLARTLVLFSLLQWLQPWSRRLATERAARLGHEPTHEELAAHFDWKAPKRWPD